MKFTNNLILLLLLSLSCLVFSNDDDESGHPTDDDEYEAGTDPQSSNSVFSVSIVSTNLNSETFEVTIGMSGVAGYVYYLEAYEGNSVSNIHWEVAGRIVPTNDFFQITDTNAPLSKAGKTYRGAVTLDDNFPSSFWVRSANEVYVPYPYLQNPLIRSLDLSETAGQVTVEFQEGIYSNRISTAIPEGPTSGFFTIQSADGDPTNAVIKFDARL